MSDKNPEVTIETSNFPPEKVAELRRAVETTFRGSPCSPPQILDNGMRYSWSLRSFLRRLFGFRHKV